MSSSPSKILEVFDNPNNERDFVIRIDSSEFTCLCPLTGQPDFADIHIEYIADNFCVELKALKNYFWSYRNEGAFHEAVTNKILDDLVEVMNPRFIRLKAIFNVRGGVYTNIECEYRKDGWKPREIVRL
jgi:7-cyano-7-deazaguanine reductase